MTEYPEINLAHYINYCYVNGGQTRAFFEDDFATKKTIDFMAWLDPPSRKLVDFFFKGGVSPNKIMYMHSIDMLSTTQARKILRIALVEIFTSNFISPPSVPFDETMKAFDCQDDKMIESIAAQSRSIEKCLRAKTTDEIMKAYYFLYRRIALDDLLSILESE